MTTEILLHSNIPLLGCEPLVHRERCFRLLDQNFHRPLVFINGGHGSGKSVLVQSYLKERQIPTVLIHLESGKDHLPIFMDTLSKGLSLFSGRQIEPEEILLLGELSSWKNQIAIVLDSDKNTEPSGELLDYLLQLLQHCTSSVTFIIVSRNRPKLPFVKLKAQGVAAEIKKEELVFQADEIMEFFKLSGLKMEEKDSQEVCDYTNGWALCLPYMTEAWRETPRYGHHSLLSEFLDEVFSNEGENLESLLELSVPHELNTETVRFLSAEKWKELISNSFFFHKTDTDTYRIIPLVREYFYNKLFLTKGKEALDTLHLQLAALYESKYQYYYAFAHNLAASHYPEAARLMQVMMNFYTPERFLTLIDGTLETICPSISFSVFSMFLFRCVPISVLQSYVPGLEKALQEMQQQRPSNSMIYLQHRLGLIHFYSGDVQRAKRLFLDSLDSSEQQESREFTIINLSLLAQCCRFEGNLAEGIVYARRALTDIEAFGAYDAHMHTVWILTELLLEQGEVSLAEPIIRELLRLSEQFHDEAARIYPLLANAKFCRLKGNLEEALHLAETSLSYAEKFNIAPDLGWICLEMGLIHQSRSEKDMAHHFFVRSADYFRHYHYFYNLVIGHIEGRQQDTKVVVSSTEQTDGILSIELLGPLHIQRDGQELKLQRKSSLQLLMYLAVNYHRKLPKDVLLEELFPESTYESQNNRFYVSLSSLRKNLEPNLKSGKQSSYILQSGDLYYLNQEHCSIDLMKFDLLVEHRDDRINRLLEAEQLYKGDLLEEFPYEPYLEGARERVKQAYLKLLHEIGLEYWSKQDYRLGIHYFDRLLEKDCFAENIYWEYIQLLLKQGFIQNAKQIAGKMRNTLEKELGIPIKERLQSQFPQLI